MKINIIPILAIILLGGCGTDESTSYDTSDKEYVSYSLIREYISYEDTSNNVKSTGLNSKYIVAASSDEVSNATTSVSITPESVLNTGIDIACLAQPEVLPIKKFDKFVEGTLSKRKVKGEEAGLLNSIKIMQQEIVQLQQEINILSQDFYQYVSSETYTDLMNAFKSYNTTYQNFGGTSNNYLLNIVEYIKLNDNNTSQIDINTTVENIVTNINSINNGIDKTTFTNALQDVSGTQLAQVTTADDVYKSVTVDNDSQLVSLYQALLRYFLINFVPELPNDINATADANTSLAISIEAYNDNITGIFQSAVFATQTAYTASSLINKINYAIGVLKPGSTPINQYEQNNNLYYVSENNVSNFDAFAKAELELALAYTARMNTLINLTLKYIYSDKPLKDFVYPSMQVNNNTMNKIFSGKTFATYYQSTLSSSQLDASLLKNEGMSNRKFPVINTNDGYIYYMYQGLNQFTKCQDALLTYNELNSTTCPSLYDGYEPSQTPGYYQGRYFSAWLYNTNSNKATMTAKTNNYGVDLSSRCDSNTYNNSQYYWALNEQQTAGDKNLTGFNCQTNTDVTLFISNGGSYDLKYLGLMWFSTSDSDAALYFTGGTNLDVISGSVYSYMQCQLHDIKTDYWGTETKDNKIRYFVDTAKFVCPDEYGDKGSTDSMVTININGYSTNIDVSINLYEQKGFHYHYDVSLNCSGNDPLCYSVDNGLCVGGNKISATFDGDNTYTLNNDGGC